MLFRSRDAPGRLRWSRRVGLAASAIEALRRPPADGPTPYAALLAQVPAGATVAAWVAEPERLDVRGHRGIGQRAARAARLRRLGPGRRLAGVLDALGARYALIEADDARAHAALANPVVRALCAAWPAGCDDALDRLITDIPRASRIEIPGDIDVYRVTLEAGVMYQIEANGSGATPLADPFLSLVQEGAGLLPGIADLLLSLVEIVQRTDRAGRIRCDF